VSIARPGVRDDDFVSKRQRFQEVRELATLVVGQDRYRQARIFRCGDWVTMLYSRLLTKAETMSYKCDICGKGPYFGHSVSHAHT